MSFRTDITISHFSNKQKLSNSILCKVHLFKTQHKDCIQERKTTGIFDVYLNTMACRVPISASLMKCIDVLNSKNILKL